MEGCGVFVVAGCQAALLFEAAEGAFDGVAVLVDLGVEGGGSPTCGAFGLALPDLVAAFGNGVLDPRRRSSRRVEGCEYALSVRSRASLCPIAVAGEAKNPSSRGSSCGLSPAWPAVSRTATTSHVASPRAWIFVVSPPRDRPSAWLSGSTGRPETAPPGSAPCVPSRREHIATRPFRRARSMLMRAHTGRVGRQQRLRQVIAGRIGIGHHLVSKENR